MPSASLRAIVANRLRSALTALGLIIGVSSVIVLVAVGQGTQKGVTDQIRGLGTDLIFIEPGAGGATQGAAAGAAGGAATLVASDAEALVDGVPGVTAVASLTTIGVQAIAGANNLGTELVATTASYAAVHDTVMTTGDFFNAFHEEGSELVAVLGARTAAELFPAPEATGESVRVSLAGGRTTLEFRVIGALAEEGAGEIDAQVFVPTSAVQRLLGRFLQAPGGGVRVTQIDAQTAPGLDDELIKEQISELLVFLHEVTEPDFVVQSQDDLIGAVTKVSNTLSILLGSIAGISLLVGGTGVMNIMLVSVTERTREIGIRRAVGATSCDVVLQFVAEALTLSLFGGLVRVLLGVGVSVALAGRDIGGQEMTTVVQPSSIALEPRRSASRAAATRLSRHGRRPHHRPAQRIGPGGVPERWDPSNARRSMRDTRPQSRWSNNVDPSDRVGPLAAISPHLARSPRGNRDRRALPHASLP